MKQKVALVLSSGGSKGLAHIGVINELEKNGFEISSISGASIGSLIGGLYAMGKLPDYTEWVKKFSKKSIWDLMDFTVSSNGLLKGEKVFTKMKSFIPDMNIEDMNIPFTAVATDILNEKEVLFSNGSFYDAIRASVAIPSIITPVKYKDTFLVDGGVLNPIPIAYVPRTKNDILVAVNLYGDKEDKHKTLEIKPKKNRYDLINSFTKINHKLINTSNNKSLGYFSLLSYTNFAMLHKLAKLNIELYQPDIVINIPRDSAKTFDFDKATELIQLGKSISRKEIKKYLK